MRRRVSAPREVIDADDLKTQVEKLVDDPLRTDAWAKLRMFVDKTQNDIPKGIRHASITPEVWDAAKRFAAGISEVQLMARVLLEVKLHPTGD